MSPTPPDLAGRLREASIAAEMNAEELAQRTDLAVGAIRDWLNGDAEPDHEEIAALAAALDVDSSWLEEGEGTGPPGDVSEERAAYQADAGWRFRPVPEDGGRDYGNANVWAFDPDLNTFVREVGQNVLDVVRGQSATLIFRLIRLRKTRLASFFEALTWDILRGHLKASADQGQKFGELLAKGLAQVEGDDELLLLRIEEHRTQGLTGAEIGTESNFTALTRNNLDSQKEKAGAGGAFGLGKAVLWRTSSLSTVLFNSDLAVPHEGKQEGRLIGRSDLSFHEDAEGHEFAGPGWFGKVDEKLAQSYWGNRALSEDLLLNRPPGVPGSSTLILGFHDPTAEEPPDAAALQRQLVSAAGKNFWPAIADGRLEIVVEVANGPDEDDVTSRDVVEPAEIEADFADLAAKRQDADFVSSLEEEGDVAMVKIPLEVPRRDGAHDAFEHEATLAVRRANSYGDGTKPDRVAFMRGTGMVVQYQLMENVRVGARPFHAAVFCGTAVDDTAEAKQAEEFLLLAEPPSHDKWELTTELASKYAKGSGASLNRFEQRIREAIGDLVGPAKSDLSDGPQGLKRLLKVKATPDPIARPAIRRVDGEINPEGAWEMTVDLTPASDKSWKAKPAVFFNAETGTGARVVLEKIGDLKNCELLDDGRLLITPTRKKVRFSAMTDPESHPLPASEAAIVVDLRSMEPTN